MKLSEAKAVLSLLLAYFPALVLEPESRELWARELMPEDAQVAAEVVRVIGRRASNAPSLAEVLAAVQAESERRRQRTEQQIEPALTDEQREVHKRRVQGMLGRIAKPVDRQLTWSEDELVQAERRREAARAELRKIEGDDG